MATSYASYQYLMAGEDYQIFDLAAELDRVQSTPPALDARQEATARRLLDQTIVISLHDHPTVRPSSPDDFVSYRQQGRDVTGYAGIAASGVDVFFDGLMAGVAFMTSAHGWKFTDVVYDLGMRLCDLAHQAAVEPVYRVADIPRLRESGRQGLVFAVESCTPIENELDRLDILFGLGIRSMGLVYSEANFLGSGLAEASDAGLTRFGRATVTRMNRLGMLIDLSHAGDRTALDAIAASEHPVAISHTGARALWPTPRMKPDTVLRACAERGGVIGIAAAPNTTRVSGKAAHDLDAVMAHFEYCAELVGIEHVAFGPDTHFGDHVAWHRAFAGGANASATVSAAAYVDGAENPAEAMRNITRWLVKHDYGEADIARVLGGNILDLLSAVWPG